jgi:hypothetical protein
LAPIVADVVCAVVGVSVSWTGAFEERLIMRHLQLWPSKAALACCFPFFFFYAPVHVNFDVRQFLGKR